MVTASEWRLSWRGGQWSGDAAASGHAQPPGARSPQDRRQGGPDQPSAKGSTEAGQISNLNHTIANHHPGRVKLCPTINSLCSLKDCPQGPSLLRPVPSSESACHCTHTAVSGHARPCTQPSVPSASPLPVHSSHRRRPSSHPRQVRGALWGPTKGRTGRDTVAFGQLGKASALALLIAECCRPGGCDLGQVRVPGPRVRAVLKGEVSRSQAQQSSQSLPESTSVKH